MNDEELLNKLYYKDLIMSGVNELYKVVLLNNEDIKLLWEFI